MADNPLLGWGLVTSLPVILLIAWVAGRLVGARPSLPRTLLAGLTGWVNGTLVSLLIAKVTEALQTEALALLPLLRRAPRHADRIATIVERGDLQLRVSLLSEDDDVRTLTRLVNRGVLAVLGSVVGVLSVLRLGTPGGPPFTGDTSLFQFFGCFGLFCARVLILRVIVAILHDGLN